MSRIYITASMQHNKFGIAMPVFDICTTDHEGGGYSVGGLHPATIAKLSGKGPEVKKGDRFDFKFNINGKRSSVGMVVNTTKYLPHLEWSSESGIGKLPLGMSTLFSSFLFGDKESPKSEKRETSRRSSSQRDQGRSQHRRHSQTTSRNSHSRTHHSSPSSRSSARSLSDSTSNTSSHLQHQKKSPSSKSSHSPGSRRINDRRNRSEDSGYCSNENSGSYYRREPYKARTHLDLDRNYQPSRK